MTQIKLDPAFQRQRPAPHVRDFAPDPSKPPPRSGLKLVLAVVIAMFVGAGVVSSWMVVTAWFGLSH